MGSSINLTRRLGRHRLALTKGNHHSPHLQNVWNKYGPDSVEFQVLETLPGATEAELIAREQFYIDERGEFNTLDAGRGHKSGHQPSAETCRRISEAKKGIKPSEATLKASMSLEAIQKRADSLKGRKRPDFAEYLRSPEHSKKTSNRMTGRTVSVSTKEKLRQASLARSSEISIRSKQLRHTDETKQIIREARKNQPVTEKMLAGLQAGRGPKSEETRRKISEARKKYWKEKRNG